MTRWNYYPRRRKKKAPVDAPPAGGEFMGDLSVQKSKYNSIKKEVDGIIFDSSKEARRYEQLKLLQQAGEISGLELQKKFILIPTQREPDIIGPRGGVKKGKVIEKEIAYYADFYYKDKDGNEVVEDTKSAMTKTLPAYIQKRKMMLYFHNIRIKEI